MRECERESQDPAARAALQHRVREGSHLPWENVMGQLGQGSDVLPAVRGVFCRILRFS